MTDVTLNWQAIGGTKELAAKHTGDFSITPDLSFILNAVTQYADVPVKPNWLMVNNTGNDQSVLISFDSVLDFTVPPYATITLRIPLGIKKVSAISVSGTVGFQFTENRYSDDVSNNYGTPGGTALGIEPGMLAPFCGSPAGEGTTWLYCNGQAVSRTDYSALFTMIGIQYGTGDGSTTFNVPDLRGRTVAGIDDSAARLTSTYFGVSPTLGANGGSESHTLVAAELASHTHSITTRTGMASGAGGIVQDNRSSTGGDATNANTGGDQPHKNVQPTQLVKWYIHT